MHVERERERERERARERQRERALLGTMFHKDDDRIVPVISDSFTHT